VAKEPAVAIAISGGSDSTALLHAALDWTRQAKRAPRLVALTVDHGLRAASAMEAETVAAHCAAAGVAHETLRWRGVKPATGIQPRARTARYDLMAAWCKGRGINVILTGHTADDQAETLVMRARRTGTAESLAGIWPTLPWNDVRIVRPFLTLRRAALRTYLAAKGVGWIEDPSNEDSTFERSRVRRQLVASRVPLLAEQAAAAQSETLRRREAARLFLARHGQVGGAGVIRLPAAATAAFPLEERQALCRALIVALRGRVTAERAALTRLAQWLEKEGPGRRTLNGLVFDVRRGAIVIGREPGRLPTTWLEVRGPTLWDHRFLVTAPEGSRVGPAAIAKEVPRDPAIPQWTWLGLPVVETPTGQRVLAISSTGPSHLEQLGIAVQPTYVNALEGFPVA
jgi:tRNA(Ile)-lysidine synthase